MKDAEQGVDESPEQGAPQTKPIKKLVLCAGMHKTGTTSVQQSLADYDDGSARYANLIIDNHSTLLRMIFDPGSDRGVERIISPKIREVLANDRQGSLKVLRDQLSIKTDTLIINAEGLPLIEREGLKRFKAVCDEYVESYEVLVYVREPIGFGISAFQQKSKDLKGQDLKGKLSVPRPKYRKKFLKFLDIFGRENCVFRLFDRKSMVGGSSVVDICHHLGLDLSQINDTRTNESLGLDAVRWLRCLYGAGIVEKTLDRRYPMARMREFLSLVPSDKFTLPKDLVATMVTQQDVKWMEKASGFKLFDPTAEIEPSGYKNLAEFMADIDDAAKSRMVAVATELGIPLESGDAKAMIGAVYTYISDNRSPKFRKKLNAMLDRDSVGAE